MGLADWIAERLGYINVYEHRTRYQDALVAGEKRGYQYGFAAGLRNGKAKGYEQRKLEEPAIAERVQEFSNAWSEEELREKYGFTAGYTQCRRDYDYLITAELHRQLEANPSTPVPTNQQKAWERFKHPTDYAKESVE